MAFDNRTGNPNTPITFPVAPGSPGYTQWRTNVQTSTNRLRADPVGRHVLPNMTPSDYNTIYSIPVSGLVREDSLFRRYFEEFEEVVVNPLKRESIEDGKVRRDGKCLVKTRKCYAS